MLSSGELSEPTRSVLYQRDLVKQFDDDPDGRAGAPARIHHQRAGSAGRSVRTRRALLLPCRARRQESVLLGRGHLRLPLSVPQRPERRARSPRPAPARGVRHLQPRHHRRPRIGRRLLRGACAPVRSPCPSARSTSHSTRRTCVWDKPPARRLRPGGGARRGRSADPLSLARDRRAAGGEPEAGRPGDGFPRLSRAVGEDVADGAGALRRCRKNSWRAGRLQARLELEAPNEAETVEIEGRDVPLEVETTAALAFMLAESPLWQQELDGFLRGFGVIDEKSRLVALSPYRPGRIPVVLVHGTASSAGRWAQMVQRARSTIRACAITTSSGCSATTRAIRSPTRRCCCATRSDRGGERSRPATHRSGPRADGRHRPQPGWAAHQDDGDRERLTRSGTRISTRAARQARHHAGRHARAARARRSSSIRCRSCAV